MSKGEKTEEEEVKKALAPYLEDLEARIDPDAEEELFSKWVDFLEARGREAVFSPRRPKKSPPTIEWPRVLVNEAIADEGKLLLQQFRMCSDALESASGEILCVRSNYGTGILSSVFGVELFFMDDDKDTLPTNWPIKDKGRLKEIAAGGVPDLDVSLAGKTLLTARLFKRVMDDYPKISRYVHQYHPDLQGPMDICELLWGSDLFVDVMDDSQQVIDLMEVITETYIAMMKAWTEIQPFREGYNAHWGLLIKSNIMLRNDSAMNFSPRMYEELIRPFDQRLLEEFGGGAVHFCGKGDHYLGKVCSMRGMYAIQMSQPEYNDMEKIFRVTVDAGIPLLNLNRQAAEEALASGRDLHGLVHSFASHRFDSLL